MVGGLYKFHEHFEGYEASYLIIGGTACETQLSALGRAFRSTNDVDIILIAEALEPKFVERFWEFIRDGKYAIQEEEPEKRQFYRFQKPAVDGFPTQIELFSRLSNLITLRPGMRYTPIPVEEGLTSLSAILMDDDYYQFTIQNSDLINGLHVATTGALIVLKAKAYLDLTERKAQGGNIDTKKINKHRNDIIRLLAIVSEDYRVETAKSIKESLRQYIILIQEQNPEMNNVIKDAGLDGRKHNELMDLIKMIFSL